MKKIGLLVVFVCLSIAIQASANEGQKTDCETSKGVWHPLAGVPQCNCTAHPELFSLLAPGDNKTLQGIRARAKVTKDVCESRELAKTSANIKKDRGGDKVLPPTPPAPLPTCSAAQEVVMAKGDEAVNDITCTGAGVKNINRITASCDNCRAPRADSVITPKTGGLYTQQVRVGSVTDAKKSHVFVTFLTKNDQQVPTVDFWVEWVPKTPPAPPAPTISPAQIACEKGRFPGTWSNDIGRCFCTNTEERNGVCVPKPVPPPPPVVKIVEDSGSYAHPFVVVMGGYAGKSGGSFFGGLGLSIDIRFLEWSGLVALGVPGATRLDANGNPVVLTNGKTDKRLPSALVRSGFRANLGNGLGANAGAFYQMEGLNGGLNTPVQTTVGGYFGPDVRVQMDGLSITLFLDATLGAFQRGSEPSRFDPGFMAGAVVDIFNHRK